MIALFYEILYRPLFNLAVLLYTSFSGHDLGVAIIVLTVLIRVALFPFSSRALKSQRELSKLAPKIQEIKERNKNDSTAQSAAIMQIYKEHNINPLSGCLPLLIQIPVLISLYRVFLSVSGSKGFDALYSFMSRPDSINPMFLGFLNLASKSPVLALMAGALQFIQTRLAAGATPKNTAPGGVPDLNSRMLYFFPVMIVMISWNLPAGLSLYWVTTTSFSILEQLYIRRYSV